MQFASPLFVGTLIKRYKRFLADVRLADGSEITIHCPNTGSMLACADPGAKVWFSKSDNPKRKYPYTWEFVAVQNGRGIAGINTGNANKLVAEALANQIIPSLKDYGNIRAEVKYGMENSRIDFLLQQPGLPDCYVEVKNVTLAQQKTAYFPDAVTSRGLKHVRELSHMIEQGHRGVLLFCVQHSLVEKMELAWWIDEAYATAVKSAIGQGLEVLVLQMQFDEKSEVKLEKALAFDAG